MTEAKYTHKEYSLGFEYNPDFDDIREVTKFLRIKSLIKKSAMNSLDNLFNQPTHPGLPPLFL